MNANDPRLPVFDIQISVEAALWQDEPLLAALCGRCIDAATRFLIETTQQPFPTAVELSLLFTDDPAVRAINLQWRALDKPTNVLSFPAHPVQPGQIAGSMLGDIVFAGETIENEARSLGIAFDDHLTHLLVHGFLHLLGYDHIDDEEAQVMENLETRILATLDLSDPYENTFPV